MYVLALGFLLFAMVRRGQRHDERDIVTAEQERGLSLTLMA